MGSEPRRAARWVVSLVLAGVLLSGCGQDHDTGPTLTFWAMGREGEHVRALIPEFERLNPGVSVRVQQIPWSAAHEKLLTAYAGEVMPDVFQAGNTWIPEFVALGAILPLDTRVAASGAVDLEDFFDGVLKTNRLDGRLWGLPWYVDTRLIFYRRDLLARAGFDHMPGTWSGWRRLMAGIREQGRHAVLLPSDDWAPLVILALQEGATLLRDDARYGDFRNHDFVAAFDFYLEMFTRGWAPRPGQGLESGLYPAISRGTVAMAITGPWNLNGFRHRLPEAIQNEWGTAPMPGPGATGPGLSIAGGASLVISRTSEHPELAWRLIEFLTARDRQTAFHRLTGDLPARRSAWQESGLDTAAHLHAFWIQLQHLATLPPIPEWERIAHRIADYSESAVRGEMTRDQALAALDRDVDAILEKRRWLLARQPVQSGDGP